MNLKPPLLLVLLVFLCVFGLFLRGSLYGFDGYASAAAVKYGWFDTLPHQPLANLVFSVLPDSLIVYKLLMFLCLFCTILPIFLCIKKKYSEKEAFLAVFLLLALSPILLFGFGELENEIFAYPLIAWGLYFVFNRKYWLSIPFFLFSLGFWLWPGYLVSNFNLFSPGPSLEQQRFSGVINVWLLLPFVFFIPLFKDIRLRVFGLASFFLWIWNTKLFLFFLFFVALAIPNALKRFDEWLKTHENWLFSRNNLMVLAVFCCVGVNVAYIIQLPTPNHLNLIKTTVSMSEDLNIPISNDWAFGYWFWYYGYKSAYTPGAQDTLKLKQYIAQSLPYLYLTRYDQNCSLLKSDYINDKNLNLYLCS